MNMSTCRLKCCEIGFLFKLLTGCLTLCPLGHAAGGGHSVGTLEHRGQHLWLLPHQCHGGEDPHAGKCPLHPSDCDCLPLCWPDISHDLYTMEKTLTGTKLWNLILLQPHFYLEQKLLFQTTWIMSWSHLSKIVLQLHKRPWESYPSAVWCAVKSARFIHN